jgi:acetolactate synthase-1/3 small subunit
MSVADGGAHREVRVGVRARDGGRCVDVLGRQIDRLVGARRVAPAPSAVHADGAVPCTA